jgi:hypothetical protein
LGPKHLLKQTKNLNSSPLYYQRLKALILTKKKKKIVTLQNWINSLMVIAFQNKKNPGSSDSQRNFPNMATILRFLENII